VLLTLYTDSKSTIFVISRLVGDDVTYRKWDFGELNPCSNSDRAFVDVLKDQIRIAKSL
jgi:hypothetical protein